MLEKEFVPYEQALALKELGFDEPCLAFYNHQSILIMMAQENEEEVSTWKNSYVPLGKQYAAPTFSQAFRWFREKYQIDSKIERDNSLQDLPKQYCYIIDDEDGFEESINFNSYEEAELGCLIKLIEIVKENKQ